MTKINDAAVRRNVTMDSDVSTYSFEANPLPVKPKRDLKKPIYRPVSGEEGRAGGIYNDGRVKINSNDARTIYDEKHPLPTETVDLTQYLVEAQPRLTTHEVTCQTEKFLARPKTPPYAPLKTGKDVSTQIDPEDGLFDFDFEVEALLDVVVGKTLEQSLIEVSQEVELQRLSERKKNLHAGRRAEAECEAAAEQAAIDRWKAQESRKRKEGERLLREQRFSALISVAEIVASKVKAKAFAHFKDVAHYLVADRAFVHNVFLPSVFASVPALVEKAEIGDKIVDDVLQNAMRIAQGKLQRARDAAAACVVNEKKPTFLRVFIRGDEFGEEGQAVGPIPISPSETVAETESKIAAWLQENYALEDGGGMRLAFDGAVLEKELTIEEANVSDESLMDFRIIGELAVEGESQGDPDGSAEAEGT